MTPLQSWCLDDEFYMIFFLCLYYHSQVPKVVSGRRKYFLGKGLFLMLIWVSYNFV